MDNIPSIEQGANRVLFNPLPAADMARNKSTWYGWLCNKAGDFVDAIPNPAYYICKSPGVILTGLALFARGVAVCDASPLRNPVNTTLPEGRSQWSPVPSNPVPIRDMKGPLKTTQNGEFVRVGKTDDKGFYPVQEKGGKKNRRLYRFKLRDYHDNSLKRATNKDGSPCPPSKPGTNKCKGRAELSNCFPPSSLKHVSKKEAKFIRASKAILNNCSGVIKNGGKARITMDLQFKELGPAIIFQLHGLPDRWLYKSPGDPDTTYRLPPDTSAKTYTLMVNNGMRFEQGGYPPLTLAIKKDHGKYFLVMTARADYAMFSEKFPRCNLKFSEETTTMNEAKCCNNERDISYIFSHPISTDMDWMKVWIDVETSDFSAEIPTEGSIKVWINGNMVAHSRTYLGRNDAPERGGSGLYAKFGLYRSSDEPVEVLFRDPVINTSPDDSGMVETLSPVPVKNTCRPLAQGSELKSTPKPVHKNSTLTYSPGTTALTPNSSSSEKPMSISSGSLTQPTTRAPTSLADHNGLITSYRSTVLQTELPGSTSTKDLKSVGATHQKPTTLYTEGEGKVSSLGSTPGGSPQATENITPSDSTTPESPVTTIYNRGTPANGTEPREPTAKEAGCTYYGHIISYGFNGLCALVLSGLWLNKLLNRRQPNGNNTADSEPNDAGLLQQAGKTEETSM